MAAATVRFAGPLALRLNPRHLKPSQVGYTVRFDDCSCAATKIKCVRSRPSDAGSPCFVCRRSAPPPSQARRRRTTGISRTAASSESASRTPSSGVPLRDDPLPLAMLTQEPRRRGHRKAGPTDPFLLRVHARSRYSVVVLDEAHERSLNTDILFGLLKGLVRSEHKVRPDFSLRGEPYIALLRPGLIRAGVSIYAGSVPSGPSEAGRHLRHPGRRKIQARAFLPEQWRCNQLPRSPRLSHARGRRAGRGARATRRRCWRL